MLNTYDIKINLKDVKKVAAEVKANLPTSYKPYNTVYMPVYYNKETGELWSKYFNNINSWMTSYRDSNIITVNVYRNKVTAQDIIDDVYANLTFGEDYYNYDAYWQWVKSKNL